MNSRYENTCILITDPNKYTRVLQQFRTFCNGISNAIHQLVLEIFYRIGGVAFKWNATDTKPRYVTTRQKIRGCIPRIVLEHPKLYFNHLGYVF